MIKKIHKSFSLCNLVQSAFEISDTGCRQSIDIPTCGVTSVSSPNYPANYDPSLDCLWIFRADTGTRIRVVFTAFDVEPSFDKVRTGFGDNSLSQSTQQREFTGSDVPTAYINPTNVMWMTFETDSNKEQTGFSVQIQDECYSEYAKDTKRKH